MINDQQVRYDRRYDKHLTILIITPSMDASGYAAHNKGNEKEAHPGTNASFRYMPILPPNT